MLPQALATLAVESVEAEPSKTPFYVLGGLLAVYAVVISFTGMRGGATFPGSAGARAGVMAVTALLVAAAVASALLTS
jgi:hypothetical protein